MDICVANAARAAMAVMRPAGYGRIILVGSTGGLHGDAGFSAYAASKGGLLAFGRSLAPVLTALASPECRLNGEYLVTGGAMAPGPANRI